MLTSCCSDKCDQHFDIDRHAVVVIQSPKAERRAYKKASRRALCVSSARSELACALLKLIRDFPGLRRDKTSEER